MKRKIYQDEEKMSHIKYLFKSHKHNEALKQINDYILEYPDELYAYVFKAMILCFQNKDDEAKVILLETLSHNPDDNVKYFAYEQLASIAVRKNNKKEAVKYYEDVVFNSNLVCLKARKELSILYYDLGRFKDAINILNVPGFNDENLNVARANVYYKKNLYGETLKALDQPYYNDGLYECAKIYGTDDSKNKSHAQALFLRGNVYSRQKKYKESIDVYKEGLKCTNNNNKVYYDLLIQLASSYYRVGEYNKSIEICKELIVYKNLNDILSSIYVLMCNCYIKLGNTKKFDPIMETCQDLKIRNLCKLELLISKFDFENALAIIPFCDMENYSVLYYELVILYRLNRYKDFIVILDMFKNHKDYSEYRKSAIEVDRMKLYMEYDRGIADINTLSYADNQYKNYSVEDAITHIKDRHAKDDTETEFSRDTDFESIYDYVQNRLDSSDVICDNIYNEYYVKIDTPYLNGIGEPIKYIGVICIPNTHKIITMYPLNNYVSEKDEYMPKIMKKEKLSRSEMFKKKYGLL